MPSIGSVTFLYDEEPASVPEDAQAAAEAKAKNLLGTFLTRKEVAVYCPAHPGTDRPEGAWGYAKPPCRSYWRAVVLPALAVLLLSAPPALAADPKPEPKPPRARPATAVSVKVYPEKFQAGTPLAGKAVHVSTLTKSSCTAWIPQDTDTAWTVGLSACRKALRENKE